ncbi:hypothetical protein [Streptomyces sp. SAJ15]|uniref:hypothetical protein n=1 Tax=Streptomyces sp. SAJ15 TaxID=2011095 RepID=UPI001185891E|nr:hypothetical protein [Streptomyces sp. SAJ15]TVL89328.1 hypothetical protein CD790_27995 [Streptomyces sp. SAJ15]
MAQDHGVQQRNQPGPEADKPLRIVPDAGEHTDDDGVLRRYVDPGATLARASSAREAIERFMAERTGQLRSDRIDLREVDTSEGAATLRIRYQQFPHDLPVSGATVQAVADVRQAGVIEVDHGGELDMTGAPDPGAARSVDALGEVALAPFEEVGGPVPADRLVRFDNNVGLRDVAP